MSALDWRAIAPEPIVHDCNCGDCDRVGELEEVTPPSLMTLVVDGRAYVTDRYLAIRELLAPIPDDYAGPTHGPVERYATGFLVAPVTDQVPDSPRLRKATVKALAATGWELRLLDHPDDASDRERLALAVVTPDGEHIGWAMTIREDR